LSDDYDNANVQNQLNFRYICFVWLRAALVVFCNLITWNTESILVDQLNLGTSWNLRYLL